MDRTALHKCWHKEAGAKGLCASEYLRGCQVEYLRSCQVMVVPSSLDKRQRSFQIIGGLCTELCFAYLPTSNSRAELAVKLTKRLLMEKVDASGDLNIDSMFQALLTQQSTSDSDCRLSTTQILFSGPLKDTLLNIMKDNMSFSDLQISDRWKEVWKL